MSVNELPDGGKEALDEALGIVVKAAQKWRRCLTVQLNGFGRYDATATAYAEGAFRKALLEVEEITGTETVKRGLLLETG